MMLWGTYRECDKDKTSNRGLKPHHEHCKSSNGVVLGKMMLLTALVSRRGIVCAFCICAVYMC